MADVPVETWPPETNDPDAIIASQSATVPRRTSPAGINGIHEAKADPHTQYPLTTLALNTWVLAGYGSIGLDAITGLNNINSTWQTVPMDVQLIASPKWATANLGQNGLVLERTGVWTVSVKVSLEFVEVNSGRRVQLRFFNVTDGTGSSSVFNYGVGRNTDAVNLDVNVPIEFDASGINDVIVVQVASSTDTFTGAGCIGATFGVTHQSEAQGLEVV